MPQCVAMQRRYVTVDVFTNRAFSGNPLAVALDAQGLTVQGSSPNLSPRLVRHFHPERLARVYLGSGSRTLADDLHNDRLGAA